MTEIVRGKRTIRKGLEELIARVYRFRIVRAGMGLFFRRVEPGGWAFVLGCYNSGTTLLWQCLAAHPDVVSLPHEGSRYTPELKEPDDLGWQRNWTPCLRQLKEEPVPEPDRRDRILLNFAPWMQKARGALFVEKTVSNLTRFEWLEKNFPDARFVGIERNGYFVCEGIHRKGRVSPPASLKERPYSLKEVAAQWNSSVDLMRKAEAHLSSFMLIKYETLMEDPVKTLVSVFNFLKLPTPQIHFEDSWLTIHETKIFIQSGNPASAGRLSKKVREMLRPLIADSLKLAGYPEKEAAD